MQFHKLEGDMEEKFTDFEVVVNSNTRADGKDRKIWRAVEVDSL